MSSVPLKKDDLEKWCQSLVPTFKDKQIVLLDGPLGAGKTELVKCFVKLLGGAESSSPTYSLINEYPIKSGVAYHIDLYRIEGEEDLESIGFWDLFESEKALIFIEWSTRLNEDQLPLSWSQLKIQIHKTDDDSHRLYSL